MGLVLNIALDVASNFTSPAYDRAEAEKAWAQMLQLYAGL